MDAPGQSEHRIHFGSLRSPGSIQLLPQRGPVLRYHPGSSAPDHRPKSQAHGPRRPSQRVVLEGHPQHKNRSQLFRHDSNREGHVWDCRSHIQRGLPELGRKSGLRSDAHQSRQLHRRSAGESELQSLAGVLRLEQDWSAASIRRLSKFHQRPIHFQRPRRHPGTGVLYPGHDEREELDLQRWVPLRLLQRHHRSQTRRAASRDCLQYQADQHGSARLLCPHSRNTLQRELGAFEPRLRESGDQRAFSRHHRSLRRQHTVESGLA